MRENRILPLFLSGEKKCTGKLFLLRYFQFSSLQDLLLRKINLKKIFQWLPAK